MGLARGTAEALSLWSFTSDPPEARMVLPTESRGEPTPVLVMEIHRSYSPNLCLQWILIDVWSTNCPHASMYWFWLLAISDWQLI